MPGAFVTYIQSTMEGKKYKYTISLLIQVYMSYALDQKRLDSIAESMTVRFKVVDNLKFNAQKHRIGIVLENKGQTPIPGTGWSVFFDSVFILEADHLKVSTSYTLLNQNVRVERHKGSLYSLSPIHGFEDIGVGVSRQINLFAQWSSVSRYDSMPNWYIHADGLYPRTIKSTLSTLAYVESFTTTKQWKRYSNDQFNPFSPKDRMDRLRVDDLGKIGKSVIPTPEQMTIDESSKLHVDTSTWMIVADSGFIYEAYYLSGLMNIRVSVGSGSSQTNVIKLTKAPVLADPEAYSLNIDPASNIIKIQGQAAVNIFHGIQTLRSLLDTYPDLNLPKTSIRDRPRFSWRGMHIDVARNFIPVDDLKRLIDGMAMYKLNKLHLHVTDDEGWRIEIPGLEELTKIGGQRCFDLEERWCVISQLGSGPTTITSGSGYYTVHQYKDMLRHAKHRHIEVIPEFDMPGHAHAAIVAMEARYHTLKAIGNDTDANYFRLADPEDNSKYFSVQQFTDNAINPCIESTFNFIHHLVREAKKLHEDIQPLRIFHFGGDEVPPGAWVNSPQCKQFLQSHPEYKSHEGLKKYFVERVSKIAGNHGVSIAGWEDGYMLNKTHPYDVSIFSNTTAFTNSWDNVWEWGTAMRAYKMANSGYKVIMSQATHLYFDQPYEPDPEERGFYWATRYSDTKKTFGFLAENLYDNIDTKRSGEIITKNEVCGTGFEKCDSLKRPENVIGIQGQLWSETVRSSNNVDFMIYPRILALAERAWHRAAWERMSPNMRNIAMEEDWKLFANSVGYKELGRLDAMGVQYRVPPPGARLFGSTLETSVTFPGLVVQYSIDDGTSWNNVTQKMTFNQSVGSVLLRSMSADRRRHSRVIELNGGN